MVSCLFCDTSSYPDDAEYGGERVGKQKRCKGVLRLDKLLKHIKDKQKGDHYLQWVLRGQVATIVLTVRKCQSTMTLFLPLPIYQVSMLLAAFRNCHLTLLLGAHNDSEALRMRMHT
jgi:hypothetical protein